MYMSPTRVHILRTQDSTHEDSNADCGDLDLNHVDSGLSVYLPFAAVYAVFYNTFSLSIPLLP